MATREKTCAASSLVGTLVDAAVSGLVEVARTAVSVHYETADPRTPVLCVCTPGAVLLPNSILTDVLPAAGPAQVGAGGFRTGDLSWLPRRWWTPARPRNLPPPTHLDTVLGVAASIRLPGVRPLVPSYDGLEPGALLGAGPGLTPAGDDVLAGALVTGYATGDPRLTGWRQATVQALAARSTTAVSRAMVHHAMEGYATAELAGFLVALCEGRDLEVPLRRLLGVGHTSGGALLIGVVHTLTTHELRGAA